MTENVKHLFMSSCRCTAVCCLGYCCCCYRQAFQGDKAEETEIERRKTNVIVHGVPESDAEDADQRIDNDMMVLATMFQEVKVENVTVECCETGQKGSRSNTKSKTYESCVRLSRKQGQSIEKSKKT